MFVRCQFKSNLICILGMFYHAKIFGKEVIFVTFTNVNGDQIAVSKLYFGFFLSRFEILILLKAKLYLEEKAIIIGMSRKIKVEY